MMQQVHKYRFQSITIFVVLTAIIFALCFFLYKKGSEKYQNLIFDSLESKAKMFALVLDKEKYEKLLNNSEVDGSKNYEKTLNPLIISHKEFKEIRYVYTVYKGKDGNIYFGLDTAARKDLDNDGVIDHSDFHSEYKDVSPILKNVFKTGVTTVTKEPYSDKWGSFIGAFVPIFNKDKKIISVLAIETTFTQHKENLHSFTMFIVVSFLFLWVIVGALSFYVHSTFKNKMNELLLIKNIEKKDALLDQEAKLSEIGKLMAGITHEINNPLAVILGCAQMAHSKLTDQPDLNKDYLENHLSKIINQAKKITKIIKSMKSLVRDGTEDPQESINLKYIIDESTIIINHKMKYNKISIDLTNIPQDVQIYARMTQIQQVFTNLISNSIDAICLDPEPWIKISYSEDNKYQRIIFQDSGKGIPDNLIEKVFQGYYSSKQNGEGSGMGLLICNKIIESHNGKFNYIQNQNTTFEILLPKQPSAL